MNKTTFVCCAVAASLGLAATPSFAQPRHDDHRNDARHAQRDRRDARDDRHEVYYYNARGPEFRRGHRLPPHLRDRQYVVSDWRHHHLSAPPRGYQWVQVGPDYVLAAIATGVIANLILNQ